MLTLNVNVSSQGSGSFQIVRTDGDSWAAAGYTPGAVFNITYPSDTSFDGGFTVTSVSGNTMIVAGANLNTGSNQSDTFTLSRGYRIMNPSYTATGLTFGNSPSGNTITRNAGSWVADGFVAGETIAVSGSDNAGTYTVQGITDSTLTLVINQNASWADPGTLSNTSASPSPRMGISDSARRSTPPRSLLPTTRSPSRARTTSRPATRSKSTTRATRSSAASSPTPPTTSAS